MIIGVDASKLLSKNQTGVEISTSELIKALIKEDQENIYWLYSPAPLPKTIIGATNRIRNIVVPGKRFWTVWALSRELKKNPPDIFWSPSNFLPYNLPKKSVATIHDLAFHLFPKSYSLKSRLLSTFALKRAINCADMLVAVSRQTKKDLKDYFNVAGENIEVVYNSLRTDFLNPQESSTDFIKAYPNLSKYFIYLGRLELRKNLLNIITAFHQFNRETVEPKLFLGGSPGYGYKTIRKLIKKLKLEDKVIIADYVPAEYLPALYKNSLGVVFVSQYEGFGLNILEGFATGAPVMTSDLGAMREIAGNAALLINPFSINDIQQGFNKLYLDSNLRTALINKGKDRLKDFDWNQSAKKLIELWKKI